MIEITTNDRFVNGSADRNAHGGQANNGNGLLREV